MSVESGGKRKRIVVSATWAALVSFSVFGFASCSLGVTPSLTTNDIADIVAASLAAPTAGGLASLQDLRLSGGLGNTGASRCTIDRSVSHSFGSATHTYVIVSLSAGSQSPTPQIEADRFALSSTTFGEVLRARLSGSFKSVANLDVVGNTVPYYQSTRFTVNGTIRCNGGQSYTNWANTQTMSLTTNFVDNWKSVTFDATPQSTGRSVLVPTNGSIVISGTIERQLPSVESGSLTAWTGVVTVCFNGSTNASVTFPDGEKKLINLAIGEVVQ